MNFMLLSVFACAAFFGQLSADTMAPNTTDTEQQQKQEDMTQDPMNQGYVAPKLLVNHTSDDQTTKQAPADDQSQETQLLLIGSCPSKNCDTTTKDKNHSTKPATPPADEDQNMPSVIC